MADTHRALETLEATDADLDLVEALLTARSDAEAVLAYSLLRATFSDRTMLLLANLREIIAELPEPPFLTSTGLDALEHTSEYEATGHSYRRLFESEHGMFGLEFVGGGTLCEGIVVHTASSRLNLHGDERTAVDRAMLAVLVHHQVLLDALLEALQALGHPLEPTIYITAEDFVTEHKAAAAGQAFGELF